MTIKINQVLENTLKFHLFCLRPKTKKDDTILVSPPATTSLEGTFHREDLTFPRRLDQIKSFVVVGVICHMGDPQCKTSALKESGY